jgi:hypothetical protein
MAGFIGARASVVSSGAERKQTYAITTTTTSLTGLAYTPTKVHVYHNGIRLVDGTDYTATDGSTITLTTAAENGDEVVVISYATFQTSDTVSAANGGTFAGNVSMNGTLDVTGATTLTGQLNTGSILPSTDNASDLGSTSKRFQDLHLSGGVSFDEDPSLVTGSVTAKTLDDYEEGTWVPAVDNVSGFDGSSISDISARYTKVGRQVFLEFEFRLGSSSGNVSAGDDVVLTAGCLPFTPIDGGHAVGTAGIQVSMGTGENVAMGYVGFSSDFKMGTIYHTVDGTAVRNTLQGGVVTYMTNA